MKKAWASESCPVVPTSSVSPMAAIAALIANRPVCSQKPSAYCGIQSRAPTSTTQPRMRNLDTGHLPRAEEAPRPPQQDREQDRVGHNVGQAAPEERDVVLVAGRE